MKNSYFRFDKGAKAVLAAVLLSCLSLPLCAQEGAPPPVDPDLEKPPPLPPKIQDEQIEPTVTIRDEEDRTVEEYRHNGIVYMVKVTPKKGGVSYYYVDTDGDGTLELDERSRALNPVQPVQWKIAEWD
jgi:hypothetical protein